MRNNDIRTSADLACHYRQYLRCLNKGAFDILNVYIARSVRHNDKHLSINGYAGLIPPGATFCLLDIVTDIHARTLAARLQIEVPRTRNGCSTPGVQTLMELVFYHFDENWLINEVWSSVAPIGAKGGRSPSHSD